MKYFSQPVKRYLLCICTVLVCYISNAQITLTKNNFGQEITPNHPITNGKLSIDLINSTEFNNLKQSSSTISLKDQPLQVSDKIEFASETLASTITVDLSADISPNLTTNVSVTIMQSVWQILEYNRGITTINISHQDLLTDQNQILGNYYMLISKTSIFDSTSDYKMMHSDGNGNLQTEYNFNGTTYITFGFAPQVSVERSIYFDGKDDYIDMANTLNLNPSNFTISAWIKRDSKNFGTVSIISKRDEKFTQGYDLRILDTNNIEIIWKNGFDQSLISNATIPFNEWHHIAAIYNGSEIAFYIDGVFDNAESKTSPIITNDYFYVGAAGKNAPSQYFSGNIDELRIWDVALSESQLRFIMNQEISEISGQVVGNVIPTSILKNDINVIPWSKLSGYFPMSTFTYMSTLDASGNGSHGTLKNIGTVDNQTAPLPYLSIQKGNWDTNETWANGNVQYIPGSVSIVDPNVTIDWNIVKTSHYVTMDNSNLPNNRSNRKLLGLYIDADQLDLNGETNSNDGNGLTISHYLSLTGKIDLEGESQLIQELYSDLDVAPTGILERDQQGPSDTFTYKYWSSPVGKSEILKNDFSYTVRDIMYDDLQPINFITSGYNGTATHPIGIADYWIWKYANQPNNDYSSWQHVRRSGTIYAGEGFTMKGPGTGSIFNDQNYVFRGKPNNGDINLTIHAGNDYLVGNPYASAIDADQFIFDNSISNIESEPTISGTLYFWNHWGGDSHYLNNYQGGYSTYNFSGGVAAASFGTNDPFIATGGIPTKIPSRYIPVGQGFFVVGKNTGTINFNNGQRIFRKERNANYSFTSNKDTYLEASNLNSEESDNRMKFRIGFKSINTIHRQLLLTIDENTSPSVDWAYDAKLNESQMDDMYWLINEEPYIIQASDEATSTTVFPIGIKTKTQGLNTITIDALENVPSDVNIYLHDLTLQLYHNLRESDYNVILNAGQTHNRFEITFSTSDDTLGVDDPTQNGIDIFYAYQMEKLILINPNRLDIKSIELFNMLGQSIYMNKTIPNSDYSEYDVKNLNTGTYIIRLTTKNSAIITKKILVQ
ncbi:MAG: T9SS type A sorting domain-containing protein [Winogradskyella sp.]|nr:T9SS type A sorting domain-containing protein [Winogradskyella sp.]